MLFQMNYFSEISVAIHMRFGLAFWELLSAMSQLLHFSHGFLDIGRPSTKRILPPKLQLHREPQWCLFPTLHLQFVSYLSIYGLLLLVSVFFYSSGHVVFTLGSLRASKVIHEALIDSVLGTTFR